MPSTPITDTAPRFSTPHFAIGRVALTVNDLDTVRRYYEEVIGLHLLAADGESAQLGAGNTPLLELRQDRNARRRSRREAGLFHAAFLLPHRGDLARWVRHAIDDGIRIAGASDHTVSEAIYLGDPEGNGIEIYADRPADQWSRHGGTVAMATDPLDIEELVAADEGRVWQGFPPGSTVGHVHLQVGGIDEAEAFYAGTLGLDITNRYQGGTFYAADGYHHHLATNIWNSQGAGPRDFPSTGLAEVAIHLDDARAEAIRSRAGIQDRRLVDPWDTPIALHVSQPA